MNGQLLGLALVALPIVACWSWLRRLFLLHACERAAVAIGLGLALPSVEFFLWRLVFGSPSHFGRVDAALWLTVLVSGLVTPLRPRDQARAVTRSLSTPIAWTGLTAVAGASVWLFYASVRQSPYGGWDAWGIWNLRAAFLAAGQHWRAGFDHALLWSHPDYPLLLSASVGRPLSVAQTQTPVVAAFVAALFTTACGLLLVGSLARTNSPARMSAAFGLLMTPAFVVFGASQYADIPLAFFVVAAAALMRHETDHRGAVQILAGVLAGCAAWTKNEGLVAGMALLVLYVIERWRRSGISEARRSAANLLIGCAPMLLVLAVFKALVATPNDIVSAVRSPGVVTMRLQDTQRQFFVLRYMVEHWLSWGGWPIAGPTLVVLAIGLIPTKARDGRDDAGRAAGWALLVQFLVFYVVYLFSPHSAASHVSSSWDRLIAQSWPMTVWWAFSRRGHSEAPPPIADCGLIVD